MDYSLRYYFIAVIDVLGQSSKLLKLNRLPTTPDEQKEAIITLRDTAGYILRLRRSFTDFFIKRNESTGLLDSLPENKRALAEKIRRVEVSITNFSDTIVIAIPLTSEDNHCLSITSIHSALFSICGMYLAALAEYKPFRCGVDVGLGVELPTATHEVYGEALVKAYRLENEIALYPRIVIGDSLYDYLDYVQHPESNTILFQYVCNIANQCKALITNDQDEIKILDVLGETFKSKLGEEEKSLVEKAYESVVQSHDEFTRQDNFYISSRYESLRTYFESKIQLWGIRPIQN